MSDSNPELVLTAQPSAPAAVILAGGGSTRMGEPKEGVLLGDGRSMLEHVVDAILPLGIPTMVSVAPRGFEMPAPLIALRDLRDGCGPLAGIEAALRSGAAAHYLVVSCDQALLTTELLRRMVSAFTGSPLFLRAEYGVDLDPFPGIWPADLVEDLSAYLNAGGRSARGYVREQDCTWLTVSDEEAELCRSMNSRADLAEAGLL